MKIKYLGLSLFIFAFSLSSFSQLKTVSYKDGSQVLNGVLCSPKTKNSKNAGVLILPAWMGIDDNAKNSAEKLASEGYYSFIADIYGEGNYPKDQKMAGEKSSHYKNNFVEYQKRIQLAMDELVKSGADASNIIVIGYCFGGTGALEAARANFNVKGVVSFHGGLGRDTTRAINEIKPKVLVCHGANDFFVPEAQVKSFQNEMRQSKADWQMVYYADAVHSFTDAKAGNNPKTGVAYNEKAAKRSWKLMLQFIEEALN